MVTNCEESGSYSQRREPSTGVLGLTQVLRHRVTMRHRTGRRTRLGALPVVNRSTVYSPATSLFPDISSRISPVDNLSTNIHRQCPELSWLEAIPNPPPLWILVSKGLILRRISTQLFIYQDVATRTQLAWTDMPALIEDAKRYEIARDTPAIPDDAYTCSYPSFPS
jgi:hypothetical protein